MAVARPIPIGDQDHRVVARAVTALLRGAQKRCDFVGGEKGTKAYSLAMNTSYPMVPPLQGWIP
jgi:hypothetical protein